MTPQSKLKLKVKKLGIKSKEIMGRDIFIDDVRRRNVKNEENKYLFKIKKFPWNA